VVDAVFAGDLARPASVRLATDALDLTSVVGDEHDFGEGGDPLLVPQFLAAVVVLRRGAQDLDDDAWVDRGLLFRIIAVQLDRTADDRDVWIGGEAGVPDAHTQIGAVGAARFSPKRIAQKSSDIHADGGVLGRAARRRPDLPFEELVFRTAVLLEPDVLVNALGINSYPGTNGSAHRLGSVSACPLVGSPGLSSASLYLSELQVAHGRGGVPCGDAQGA
jgi:hypothetical protein